MVTSKDMVAIIRQALVSRSAAERQGKRDSREAWNPKFDKRSHDDRRKTTDRRRGQADWTGGERRTRDGRRSRIGRRRAAD